MRLRFYLVGLLLLAMAAASFAQYRSERPNGDPTKCFSRATVPGPVQLPRPFRSVADAHVAFGGIRDGDHGGRSLSQGLYMNRIDYQISKPLSVTTHLGYRFTPSGPAEWNPGVKNGDFVGGADLNWRPTSNTLFRISAYRGYNPNPYYGMYGWEPYDYDRSYFGRP